MVGDIYIKLSSKGSTGIDRWDSTSLEWDDGYGGDVKEILIWHGADVIHSIQTTYQRNGVNVISHRHGGVGENFEVVSIDEPLLWVSGHHSSWCLEPEIPDDEEEAPYNYCKVIRSLKFGTARATFGPFGDEVGEPFIFKSGIGGIGGFHGRSRDDDGSFLQAFGVYIRTMATQVIGGVPSIPAPALTKGMLHSSTNARLLAPSSSGVVQLLEPPSAARMANPSSAKEALAESVDSM